MLEGTVLPGEGSPLSPPICSCGGRMRCELPPNELLDDRMLPAGLSLSSSRAFSRWYSCLQQGGGETGWQVGRHWPEAVWCLGSCTACKRATKHAARLAPLA